MTLCSKICAAVLDFIFPLFCVSCPTKIVQGILCQSCSKLLELADITHRCPGCFIEYEGVCPACMQKQGATYQQAFVCETFGPASALAKNLLLQSGIERNVGSLITVQLCKLSWPIVDVMIPIIQNGYDPQGVAKQIASLLPVEISPSLYRQKFQVYRYGLALVSRYKLSNRFIYADKSCLILSIYAISQEDKQAIMYELALCCSGAVYFLSFLG